MMFMVPISMAQASSALIGNCIGANNVELAKRFYSLILKVAIPLVVTMAMIPIFARR